MHLQFINPQIIKNIGSANGESAKCQLRSANLTNYLSPQICGFAICGTYLRTTHFWLMELEEGGEHWMEIPFCVTADLRGHSLKTALSYSVQS